MSPEVIHATLAGMVSMYGAALMAKEEQLAATQKALAASLARVKELEEQLAVSKADAPAAEPVTEAKAA
jgi:hypothetical protein